MASWLEDPLRRPTFTNIKERLESLISEGTPYLDFDYNESRPYYNVASFFSIEDSGTEDSLDASDNDDGTTRRFESLDRSKDVGNGGLNGKKNGKGSSEKLSDRYAWPERLARSTANSPAHSRTNTPPVEIQMRQPFVLGQYTDMAAV